MFKQAVNFNQDIIKWDVSKLTDMDVNVFLCYVIQSRYK